MGPGFTDLEEFLAEEFGQPDTHALYALMSEDVLRSMRIADRSHETPEERKLRKEKARHNELAFKGEWQAFVERQKQQRALKAEREVKYGHLPPADRRRAIRAEWARIRRAEIKQGVKAAGKGRSAPTPDKKRRNAREALKREKARTKPKRGYKLQAKDVAEILNSTETTKELAQRFGVSYDTIQYHRNKLTRS